MGKKTLSMFLEPIRALGGRFLILGAAVGICWPFCASPAAEAADQPASSPGVVVMEVPPPAEDGADIEAPAYQDDPDYDRLKSRYFKKGLYNAIWVGRYLDEEPAQRMARHFQSRGLTAFVLKKKIEERRLFANDPVGDFYMVLVGLFGVPREADILGQRLKAEGQVRGYQVVPVDAPAELDSSETQTQPLSTQAAKTSREAQERASRPLSPNSPAATGEAFKKNVYGRYVGSFRDPLRAQAEAERMTAAGWPASVHKDPGASTWYRVYLAPTEDHRDWKADEPTLTAARRSAATQPGIVILADMSSLGGGLSTVTPNAGRTDASACAGFSEAGRLGAVLNRTIIYIPDTSYTAALVPITYQEMRSWKEIPARIKAWWTDEKARPQKKALYGPAIFNRPEMEQAVSRLAATPEQASLAIGLTEVSNELSTIPGRKVLLVFSEFLGPDQPQDVRAALGQLKSAVTGLEPIFIYGDTDGAGYALANDLAREFGSGQAWDGCLLLNNNGYFEKYIKAIFR